MIEITLHGKNGSRTIEVKSPRGFPTRHVRTRNAQQDMPIPAPKPLPEPSPVPACPVLKAIHRLTSAYGGDGYFIFDEIFVTVRQECSLSRDALLETLRGYYRDGKVAFRQGYGSQLQFALKGDTP